MVSYSICRCIWMYIYSVYADLFFYRLRLCWLLYISSMTEAMCRSTVHIMIRCGAPQRSLNLIIHPQSNTQQHPKH